MNTPKEALIIAGLLVVAIIVGSWTDQLAWCLLAATLVWIGLQVRQHRAVAAWTKHPLRRPKDAPESWFVLAYRPYRSIMRQRRRARAMADRMREVLNLAQVIPDGIIIINAVGELEGFNQAAKQLLMLRDQDIGLGLATVVRIPQFIAFLRSRTHDEPLEFTSPFDPNVSYEARRVSMENGHSVIIVRDITALNRLLTMRQNFIANVSHELRTPLTVVHGYLETMSDPAQPEELRLQLISRLQGPMDRMRSLVDDLLLLSQLESTPVAKQKDLLAVPEVMRSAVKDVVGLCARPDQIAMQCATQNQVLAIEREIHSLLVNLLSNALRYSPPGSPVEFTCVETDEGKLRFAVQDHGIGIAEEHIARITERFYRVDMAAARGRGGTGLGLAIAKHVLRRHDSTLCVESTLGVGSRFYFDLDPAPTTISEIH